MFNGIYANRKVLITGSTGFKGSWLHYWLQQLGAEVLGIGLPMPGEYSHAALLKLPCVEADIRDGRRLQELLAAFRPDVVFHLAAQPLVRLSYKEPVATFETNVLGTAQVLEAVRGLGSVKAVVAISSDKCYDNKEQFWGYRETDPMGGYDPYSASKGCTELVINSYRSSFFNNADYGKKHHTLLASGRAGNVIGGGDWGGDRLVPDLMKAAARGGITEIRSPRATRPWQHVLEPLSGYLALGQKLLEGQTDFAEGWNFGPADDGMICVEEAANAMTAEWDAVRININPPPDAPHEAGLLRLDCSKARHLLKWHGVWSPAETFSRTASWYRDFYTLHKLNTADDLASYIQDAEKEKLEWTK